MPWVVSPSLYSAMVVQMDGDSQYSPQYSRGMQMLAMTPRARHNRDGDTHLAELCWIQALLVWDYLCWSSGVL